MRRYSEGLDILGVTDKPSKNDGSGIIGFGIGIVLFVVAWPYLSKAAK